MITLGLTGSIGMGKSTTAEMFRAAGVPVFDADACVHGLYARGGAAVPAIAAAFPDVVVDGAVDRKTLSDHVLHDTVAMKRLEAIVHPLAQAARQDFLEKAHAGGADIVLVDIPLLFETGSDADVDKVVVVTADPEIQRARVLARPGMDAARFEAMLSRQLPDTEKRKRADFIIDTGLGLEAAQAAVHSVLAQLRQDR